MWEVWLRRTLGWWCPPSPPSVWWDLCTGLWCCALICLRSAVRVRDIDNVPVWCPCLRCLSESLSPRTGSPTIVSVIDNTRFVLLGLNGWCGFMGGTSDMHVRPGDFGMLSAVIALRILRRDSRSHYLLTLSRGFDGVKHFDDGDVFEWWPCYQTPQLACSGREAVVRLYHVSWFLRWMYYVFWGVGVVQVVDIIQYSFRFVGEIQEFCHKRWNTV